MKDQFKETFCELYQGIKYIAVMSGLDILFICLLASFLLMGLAFVICSLL